MVAGDHDLHLRSAADLGDLEQVISLIEEDANINSCSENGVTALQLAAFSKHPKVVSVLIQAEARLDTTNQNGQTALHLACLRGDLETVTILTEAGCSVNATTRFSKMTALHLAALNGFTDICRQLLDKGANKHLLDQVNKTAAYYARNDDIKTLLFTPRESLPVGETKQAAPVRDGTRLFDSPLPVDNPSNQRASQLFTFPTMEREPTLDVMPPASKPVIMGTKDTPRITRKNLNQ